MLFKATKGEQIFLECKRVVVMIMHSELESVYPALNVSIGAAVTGANVSLVFDRDGVDILSPNYFPVPSEGRAYLANALSDFNAPSINELLEIAQENGVKMVVIDRHLIETDWEVEERTIKSLLNDLASADLFVHF